MNITIKLSEIYNDPSAKTIYRYQHISSHIHFYDIRAAQNHLTLLLKVSELS